MQCSILAVRRARAQRSGTRARNRKAISFKSIMVKQVFVHRIGFRRTRTRWLFEMRRCRSLIEAVCGKLQTYGPVCYTRSIRVRVPIGYRSLGAELSEALALRISIARTNWGS